MKRLTALILVLVFIFTLVSCEKKEGELKYVFLFIGDGMGMNTASLHYDTLEKFDTFGSMTTYNLSSEITDSASAATAMASGEKTKKGYVGLDGKGKELATLTDFFKKKGMKVGLVSSQAVNHATPAAFYAHNLSRYNYYEIGLDFINSKIDLFAGAGFLIPDGDKGNLYELAGERLITSAEEYLPYEIDRKDEPSLADYLSLAIDGLDGEKGFFIMCEGGRIDSALHRNDASSAMHEMKAFSSAIERALDFYKKHPDETLIVVTADHETGGLTLGYTETEYELYPDTLLLQKISGEAYEKEYVASYIENKSSFDTVLLDLESLFGLENLTAYERDAIENAYIKTMLGTSSYTSEDWVAFSDKCPLAVTATTLVARRAGLSFTTFYHTASPVGVWAKGVGEEAFSGFYDNTEIYEKIINNN